MKKTKQPSKQQLTTNEKNCKEKVNKEYLPYISWSRIDAVEQGLYTERYIYGENKETKWMRFGTYVTEALEGKVESDDEILNAIKDQVPKYPENDHEESVVLKIGKENIKVLGRMDGWDEEENIVGEYKTSTTQWGQQKAENHGQMHLYSWMKWKKKGLIPSVQLTWIETIADEETGEMFLTGKYETYNFKLTLKDMLLMEVRIKRAYEKIKKVVDNELAL